MCFELSEFRHFFVVDAEISIQKQMLINWCMVVICNPSRPNYIRIDFNALKVITSFNILYEEPLSMGHKTIQARQLVNILQAQLSVIQQIFELVLITLDLTLKCIEISSVN